MLNPSRLSRQCSSHSSTLLHLSPVGTLATPSRPTPAQFSTNRQAQRIPSRSVTAHSTSEPCRIRHLHTDTALPRSDAQKRTIYALSTPPGRGGVGVIRISGPDAPSEVWSRMVKPYNKQHTTPTPWKLHRCLIIHPETGETLDDGLAVFFKGPKSFTSEDTIELHIHAGRATTAALLNALSLLPSLRPAAPGEFTRRAFLSGRMDLTQVEGLKDLIDAETEGQRKIAVRAAEGEVRRRLEGLRKGVVGALAKVEALIDFGEGEEIEEGVYEGAKEDVRKVMKTVQGYLNDHRRGELVRSGLRLAIFGPPNAGKSSLLNFLAQREAAIVTAIPGTTRDILEVSLDIGGLPIIVADTAGLRKTDDVVEKIGIERARKAVQNADISICVLSLPDLLASQAKATNQGPKEDWRELVSPNTFFLFNKSDLVSPASSASSAPSSDVTSVCDSVLSYTSTEDIDGERAWTASLGTGEGADDFLRRFGEALKKRYELDATEASSGDTPILITRSRHRDHLQAASNHLEAFLTYDANDVVFAAEELRYAAQAIGKVTGVIGVEDVLDAVFRDFCIGK